MTLITEPTKQRIANLFYLSSKKSSKEKFNYDGQADVSPLGSRASLATEREARGFMTPDICNCKAVYFRRGSQPNLYRCSVVYPI